jgi:hypothetical protein
MKCKILILLAVTAFAVFPPRSLNHGLSTGDRNAALHYPCHGRCRGASSE